MKTRLVTIFFSAMFAGGMTLQAQPDRNPTTAAADADRDIAVEKIRFCYVGGIASFAPGLPPNGPAMAKDYPRIAVGPQGCDQKSDLYENNLSYATLYNKRMWAFLTSRLERRK